MQSQTAALEHANFDEITCLPRPKSSQHFSAGKTPEETKPKSKPRTITRRRQEHGVSTKEEISRIELLMPMTHFTNDVTFQKWGGKASQTGMSTQVGDSPLRGKEMVEILVSDDEDEDDKPHKCGFELLASDFDNESDGPVIQRCADLRKEAGFDELLVSDCDSEDSVSCDSDSDCDFF